MRAPLDVSLSVFGLVNPWCFGLIFGNEMQMKTSQSTTRRIALWLPLCATLALLNTASAADAPAGDLVPLDIKLPAPAFKGTPKDIQLSAYVEPLSDKPRAPMMVPAGLKNLAPGAKLSSSDKNATSSTLQKVIDADKEATDESIIFLRKGVQWVQLDLGEPAEIFAITLWHAHNSAKVYHAIVVQAADDPDFVENVRVLYNNDQENKAGLGVGTDREYFETHEGRLINAKGVKARYLRFYSKGSTESALNEYTEIEVYGRAAK
jgi:hypothetical protein